MLKLSILLERSLLERSKAGLLVLFGVITFTFGCTKKEPHH